MDLTTDSRDQGRGPPVIPQLLSNDTIATLERRITNDDLVKLKFLSKEWITRENWPAIKTFPQFVTHLKNEFKFNDEFRTVLIELLYIIQRYDLLKLLGSCKHTAGNQERKLVNRYWKDWYERVERVEVDNVESISDMLLLPLRSSSYRPEILEELTGPLQELLGEQGVILNQLMNSVEGSGDMDQFYHIRKAGTYGLCIIINNKNFPEPQVRHGTEIDNSNLMRVFESFDFVVETRDDLTSSEMQQWIMDVAGRNNERFDCFVCWILTHGSEGHIQGVNTADPNNCLNIQQHIIQPFCKKAKTLTDKPKLFFINACQGKDKQGFVGIKEKKEPEESLQTDNAVRTQISLPDICDYLLAMPTILGYAAYRSTLKGTWFVKAFVEEFEHFGDKEDIMDVLLKVHANVARGVGQIKEKGPDGNIATQIDCKQIPETSHTFRKKLYLRKKRQPKESE